MGELADRYAQAFLEAGGDGAELALCGYWYDVRTHHVCYLSISYRAFQIQRFVNINIDGGNV